MSKIIMLFFLLSLSSCLDQDFEENYKNPKAYTGRIIERGKEEPTRSQDAKYYVMVQLTQIDQQPASSVIRVDLTVPEWYRANLHQGVTYHLNGFQLYRYGNTKKPQHLTH